MLDFSLLLGCSVPKKACPEATPSHLSPSRAPKRPDPKGPKWIPPEAEQEYVNIMKGLLGHSGQWAQDAVQPGQEDGAFPDLGLLSYMEELCSQEDFITKGHGLSPPCPGTRGASGGVGTSPVRGMRWPADGSSEDEEQLPSLAFLMTSPHSLLPWVPALSPASTSGRLRPGGRRPRGATKARSAQRRGLSSAAHLPSKAKKQDVIGGPIPTKKLKLSPEFGVSGGQALALGLTGPSQL
ncbi:Protein FAM22E [Tupaia chinensis]|uniref:Protein FAM22E n=1 Tax=Tupaia chinensis TaxID=246437 RepID=L9JNA1_TUPCH|nr:Protein FAM22E [Tupaia chinensis]